MKLNDGRVLVAGGANGSLPINSAEIYKHGEGFTMAAYMNAPRSGHTCTLLDDGTVLAYGGGPAAEIYDPAGDRWESVEPRRPVRRLHTATKIATGDVLFIGGKTTMGNTARIERWNNATAAFDLLSSTLATARKDHAATLLPDGRILVTGGAGLDAQLSITEIL